jgi:hypothetical protein
VQFLIISSALAHESAQKIIVRIKIMVYFVILGGRVVLLLKLEKDDFAEFSILQKNFFYHEKKK